MTDRRNTCARTVQVIGVNSVIGNDKDKTNQVRSVTTYFDFWGRRLATSDPWEDNLVTPKGLEKLAETNL